MPERGGYFNDPIQVEITRWQIVVVDRNGMVHVYTLGADGVQQTKEEAAERARREME
jgi:hypothetical protein